VDGPLGQGQVQGAEGHLQTADFGMVQPLGAFVTDSDVVTGPHGAEVGAERGQFADELTQGPVVRFTSGFGAEHCDRGPGAFLPVDEEVGGAGVEEEVTGEIGAAPAAGGVAVEHR